MRVGARLLHRPFFWGKRVVFGALMFDRTTGVLMGHEGSVSEKSPNEARAGDENAS